MAWGPGDADRLMELLRAHPTIANVRLGGSRAAGTAGRLSDWDFLIQCDDFAAVARDLDALLAPLRPLAAQWDPFGHVPTFMLMLSGPDKIDLIFPSEDPGSVAQQLLVARSPAMVDAHFWDWVYWLGSKQLAGKTDLVRDELARLGRHLLAPLGATASPGSIEESIRAYRDARAPVPPLSSQSGQLEREVLAALRANGFAV